MKTKRFFLILLFLISSLYIFEVFAQNVLVYQVNITGVIDMGMAGYVKRAIKDAEAAEAKALLLKINTPGGRVDAAVEICDALFATSLRTVSFIDSQAISAGALIAVSTSVIGMTDYATIGDIEPQPTSEKAVSYIRGRLRAAAEKYDRPADILAAMADKDIEIEGVTAKGKLVTLTTEEAIKHKVAEYKASSAEELLNLVGFYQLKIKEVPITWAEKLVRLLTHPLISPMLLSLGFLGIFIEIRTPGFGVPGILGLACLILFFGGHYLVGLAGMEAFVLFILGVGLVAAEVLVVPGFGLTGIFGGAAIIASLFLALSGIGHIPTPLIDYQQAFNALGISIILVLILTFILIKRLPKTQLWQEMVLTEGAPPASEALNKSSKPEITLGALGVTATPLRPAGKMKLSGYLVDVVTLGDFINEGVKVKVVDLSGNRVVVTKEE